MLVTSNVNNYTTQINSLTYKKTSDNDYFHKAVKLEVNGEKDKIEFRDIESGKLVEISLHEDIQKNFEKNFSIEFEEDKTTKATGELEKYLQTMWSKYQNDTNTKDINNDGYLDIDELSTSKRNLWIGTDDNNKVTLASREKLSFEDMAKAQNKNESEMIKDYLSSNFVKDDKVSVDLDFNGFLLHDKNLDTNFSNKETLLSMGFSEDEINPSAILSSIGFSVQEQLKKWAEEQKEKGLQELYGTKPTNISMEQLVQMKEKLQISAKYINTQADNARVFSLKI